MLNLQKIKKGTKLLVQTNDWFRLKNAMQSNRFWGVCKAIESKDIFGFKPSGDANWFMQIGTGDDSIFVAGCRIHYAQVCEEKPTDPEIHCIS